MAPKDEGKKLDEHQADKRSIGPEVDQDTEAGSQRGAGYGVTSGTTTVGASTTSGTPAPPQLPDQSSGPKISIDPEAGTGVPPRAAQGDIFRDPNDNTLDADAIRNTDTATGPDVRTGAKSKLNEPKEEHHGKG